MNEHEHKGCGRLRLGQPRSFILLLAVAQWVWCAPPCAGQPLTILGRNSGDKVLAAFWAQQNNASNAVVGLNANHGSARFVDELLPTSISGKTFIGTFTGTNSFVLRAYDTGAAAYQSFNFDWSSGAPANSNTVSRVGAIEGLSYKTLRDVKFGTSLALLTGILKANGSSYAGAIAGWSGTNYVWIGGTNRFTIIDGVVTEFTGGTNILAVGIENLNGLSGASQTFRTGTSGTNFNISSSGTNHTFNLPTAAAGVRGLLSAADWATFNAKQDASANLTALSAFNANGLLTQVAPNTFAGRLIVSGDGSLEIVNGDGVSGDIDIRLSLSSGYLYIPTIAGTPLDTPTVYAGRAPIVYDTTGNKLWIYNGAWRSATFAP